MSIKDNLNEVNENLKKFASHGETPKLIAVTKTVDLWSDFWWFILLQHWGI